MQRALVVDDSLLIRTQISDVLESAGFSIVSAADGAAGFAEFEAGDFDIVVTDVVMPVCDGLELTRNIRRKDADIPVIVVTSVADDTRIKEARDSGASSYLLKPVDEEALVERVKAFVPSPTCDA